MRGDRLYHPRAERQSDDRCSEGERQETGPGLGSSETQRAPIPAAAAKAHRQYGERKAPRFRDATRHQTLPRNDDTRMSPL
jgi:hypothetical protein